MIECFHLKYNLDTLQIFKRKNEENKLNKNPNGFYSWQSVQMLCEVVLTVRFALNFTAIELSQAAIS